MNFWLKDYFDYSFAEFVPNVLLTFIMHTIGSPHDLQYDRKNIGSSRHIHNDRNVDKGEINLHVETSGWFTRDCLFR